MSQTPAYRAYVEEMDQAWERYLSEDLGPLREWVASELGDVPAGPVFYPFSGPDILNAVTIYPRGTRYILFGLEAIGGIPRPASDSDAATMAGLERLKASLTVLLGRNYFITQYMAKEIGRGDYNGVTAVMMFFLARSGYEVLDSRTITLDPEGQVLPREEHDPAWGRATEGTEIRFRARGASGMDAVKTVWYFPGDASDNSFAKRVGLVELMMDNSPATTLLKAASYLMYNPEFDDVRAMVLARSSVIVSESSGIPFHYLDNDGWDLKLYGSYDKPIRDFSYRCQPDLKAALEERGEGPLDFNFGYQFRTATHIIVARRAEGRAVYTPRFDYTNSRGEGTTCTGNTISIKISRSF